MAFVIQKKTEPFWYSVDVPTVTDTGNVRVNRFDVQFRRFSRSELAELRTRSQNAPEGQDIENDTDYILEIAQDWRGVSDESGSLSFNRENLRLLIDDTPNAAGAIVGAFFHATLGGGAKRGN